MKKIVSLIITLALFFTFLVGCDDSSSKAKNTNLNKIITTYPTDGKETKLVPDPNATGDLNISSFGYYDLSNDNGYYNIAIKMYNELYPNVKVNLNVSDYRTDYYDYATKLSTEIMAGKGPDVFWVPAETVDPYKMMKAGAFADLTSYFENDPNFNISDYNQTVFYDGQMDGKQYIIPLNYQIPLYLTSQKIIDETGFNVSKCKDYFSCGKEISRVAKENKLACKPQNLICSFTLPYIYPVFTELDWINFSTGEIKANTPKMGKAYSMIKEDFSTLKNFNDINVSNPEVLLQSKSSMFAESRAYCFNELIQSAQLMIADKEKPIIFPWRDINGGIQAVSYSCMAVNSNSKNIQNAYNFIKILISPEFLSKTNENDAYSFANIPISNIAVRKYLENRMKDSTIYFQDSGIKDMKGISKEFIDQYMKLIDDVAGTSYDTKALYILEEIMQPYFEGKKSYDECIKEAQQKLEIYITE